MTQKEADQIIIANINSPLNFTQRLIPFPPKKVKDRRSRLKLALAWIPSEVDFLKNNLTITDDVLSKELKKSIGNIQFQRQRLGIKRPVGSASGRRKWTHQDKSDFKSMYPTKSMDELLTRFSWSTSHSLHEMARKQKLKREVEYRKGTVSPLLEETPEAYYWIGLAMADGWISEDGHFVVTLHEKDISHLQKLADFLQTNVGNMQQNMKRVAVMDHILVPQIKEKFNFKKQKTYNPPNLSLLDTREKFLSFWAGFIDGDGSISLSGGLRIMNHNNWRSTLVEFEKKLFYTLNIPRPVYTTKSILKINKSNGRFKGGTNYYALFQCGRQITKLLKTELLKLNLPLMERKWSRIIE